MDYAEYCLSQGLNFVCMTESDFGLGMSITGCLVGFAFMIVSFLVITNVKC